MNPAGIDPKWVFYLGILVTVQTAIGQGAVSLTNVFPEAWIPFVKGWSQLLGFIGTTIMTALSGFSSKASGPLVKSIVLAAVLAGGLLAFPGDASAQTPLRRPQITGDIVADTRSNLGLGGQSSPASGALNNILGALDDKLLPDLQYALKLATAADSKVTAPCYQAWIDIIQKRKTAVTNADGTPLDLPNPRLITDFEKAVELRNALQPESPFMLACSPVANMVKQDMIRFIGAVLAGGAGLATLVPGL